jgi:photosystem II stability/assembly factor-like uncharacterized protein
MRRYFPLSWSLPAVVVLLVTALVAVPAASRGEELSREQQIADLEKQIQDLSKRLADLRREVAADTTAKQPERGLPASWVKGLQWRCIGPAAMGGRIVALSVFEADPTTYWVATASGGLLRTINNGTTFEHQFDHESTVSIGDVCVAPSDRNIVWVGTGENNPRNSVSYGDGVYKSTDGGKTWHNMGLKKSFQIGRVVVHPKDPNIVYVGTLGRLYGPSSEDRGLFKTTDGGKTWERLLFVDERTGIIDIQMHPTDPETLLVTTWERQRDSFDSHRGDPPLTDGYDAYDPIKKWGPGSGLYKTTDGGKHFKHITSGLPAVAMGRIGLSYLRKNPNVVWAIIDTEKIGLGSPPAPTYLGVSGDDAPGGGAKLDAITDGAPAAKAGLKPGDVVKAADKKEVQDYMAFVSVITSHQPGDKLALTVLRGKETVEVPVVLGKRPEEPKPEPLPVVDFKGATAPAGVRITEMREQGPSVRAGLLVGDVLVAVEGKKVANFKELTDLLNQKAPGSKFVVKVQRGTEVKDLNLTTLQRPPKSRPYAFWYGGQRPNVQVQQGPGGTNFGGVYKSLDGGETWARVNSLNPRPMYFSQVRADPLDENCVYVLGIEMHRTMDGGKTFKQEGTQLVHPDQHVLWIDPRDNRHLIVGCDGGFYVSYDRAAKWDYLCSAAIGQFYHVAIDNSQPYRVFGGLQDNGSWGGPSISLNGRGPINEDWFVLGGGDGFVCRVSAEDPDLTYFESQDGFMIRRHLKTGEFKPITPKTQRGTSPYRFNWNTPFILSSHNPRIFYAGGNYVFRSLNCGDDLRPISPEIARTGRGTATALAESPRDPAVLWAGTDDGMLWVSRDNGTTWTNVAEKVGLPGPRWVASIEPSRHVDGRCYVVFDGHRSDDDNPYVYVTEDFGQSWKSLRGNLPWGSTRVLREDLEAADVLYLGTEFGAWASIDRGGAWTKINNNLPTVAVHEFAQHPTTGEMVAATHGRSLWALDVSALRQMTPRAVKASTMLFKPPTAIRWRREPSRGQPYGAGHRGYFGDNPPPGGQIYYSLSAKAQKLQLQVQDYSGKVVRTLPAVNEAGLHRVGWDLVVEESGGPLGVLVDLLPLSGGAPAEARGRRSRAAPPGMYRIVLTVDGHTYSQGMRVENDPTMKAPPQIADEPMEEDREKEERSPKKIDD